MDAKMFSDQFDSHFRQIYSLGARRLKNSREALTVETTALLEHLAITGPVTVGELTRHLGRAASTISEMVEPLVKNGLIERDRDPADGRRSLLWLSAKGQSARLSAQSVLDRANLQRAADALPEEDRVSLLNLMEKLIGHLSKQRGSA